MKNFLCAGLLFFLFILAVHAEEPPPTVPEDALEVTANGTLEWLREDQLYIARGDAVAKRNDMTIKADTLAAKYSEGDEAQEKKSGIQINQVTADNDVHFVAPTAQAFGDHGIYDLNRHVIQLTGKNLRLITPQEVVTARDSLEYYELLHTGVARGDAVAVRGQDKLSADVLAAKFASGDDKKPDPAPQNAAESPKANSLERIDAQGHVILVTVSDIVHGDQGVYNALTDQATVTGNVKVTRDQNQLNGARAEVDMATGISRVYGGPKEKVRGLFVPTKKDKPNQTAAVLE